jgi:ATP-binding cassette subfamily B protein
MHHGRWHGSGSMRRIAGGGHSGTANSALDEEEQLGAIYEHRTVSRLLPYLGKHKRNGILALVSMLVFTASNIAYPAIIKVAIDRYILPGDASGLVLATIWFFSVAVVGAIANRMQLVYMELVGQGLVRDLRNTLFQHLQTLSMGFWDRSQVGRIMSRVTNDVNQIQEVMTQGLVSSIAQLLTLVGIVAVMVRMDPRLAPAALAAIPVLILIVSIWQKYARQAFIGVRQAIAVVNGTLQEDVSGARAVQSMRREKQNISEFDQINRNHLDANIRAARVSAIMMPVIEIQSALALGVIVVFGGYRVLNGQTTVGELVAFSLYAQRFFEPIRQIITQYTALQRAMAGGTRVFELLDTISDVRDQPEAPRMPVIHGEIAFNHVTFEYIIDQPILKDINLVIHPGETIALVGPTGAGKTTFVNLVARLYEISDGSITIDGNDIREFQQRSISTQMGVVLQDPFLFSGSIHENILFGRPDATADDVIASAQIVGAHDFIMQMSDGYSTEVTERGMNLSVGQRQLISFARAILSDPRILILDEATANIDTHTERIIQEALRELLKGRTSLVIAHRLSTIRNADRIIVLENGSVVEIGNHEELLSKGNLYTRLYTMASTNVNETGQAQNTE